MRRFLETLFRRKDIFFIPIILTPLIALVFLVLLGAQSQVTASLWVAPDPYATTTQPSSSSGSSTTTPSQTEAQALTELLSTDSFQKKVLDTSGLTQRVQAGNWPVLNPAQQFSKAIGLDRVPLLGGLLRRLSLAGPASQQQAMADAMNTVGKGIQVTSKGNNLMTISYTGSDAATGQALVNAVISDYQTQKASLGSTVGQQAIKAQQAEVTQLQQQMNQALNAVNAFIQAHPAPRTTDAENSLTQLQSDYTFQQSLYQGAVRTLSTLRQEVNGESATGATGQTIQVIDPPAPPASSGSSSRLVIMILFLAIVVGAALGSTGIAIITWTDGTVRSMKDLDGLVHTPLAGQVPAISDGHKEGPHLAWLIARSHESP